MRNALICLVSILTLLLGIGCDNVAQPEHDLDARFFAQGPNDGRGISAEGEPRQQSERHVIRRARLSIKVDDFKAAQASVRTATTELGGFVARNEQRRENSGADSGTLIVKIPVERYNDALTRFRELGKIYELSEQADDATDRVSDLDARLRNAKQLEARILAILRDQTGTIADIIEAERELAAARQRIEELSGRAENLKRQVRYAVFTLHLFVSGSRDVDARSWYGPLMQDLRDLGFVIAGSLGALITVIVAAIPWLLALGALRRWWRKRKAKTEHA